MKEILLQKHAHALSALGREVPSYRFLDLILEDHEDGGEPGIWRDSCPIILVKEKWRVSTGDSDGVGWQGAGVDPSGGSGGLDEFIVSTRPNSVASPGPPPKALTFAEKLEHGFADMNRFCNSDNTVNKIYNGDMLCKNTEFL